LPAPGAGNPLPEGFGLFALDTRVEGPEVLIVLSGELDLASAPTLSTALFSAMGADSRRIVIDLAGLSFMGSSGVHVIASARTAQAGRGGELVLRGPDHNVRRLFDLLDLNDWLEGHASASIERSAPRARARVSAVAAYGPLEGLMQGGADDTGEAAGGT
jgi:anti-sigma B factor antagonist